MDKFHKKIDSEFLKRFPEPREDVQKVLKNAEKIVEEKRKAGWKQADFAKALKGFFDEPKTG